MRSLNGIAVSPPPKFALRPMKLPEAGNPMTSVTMGFRWSLYGTGPAPDVILALVFYVMGLVTLGGLYFFRKVERTIADIV